MLTNPPIKHVRFEDLPLALKRIPKPPRHLSYQGSLDALQQPCLAVVGTRKPTIYGKTITQQLTEVAARHGITIVSGLAFGVDASAHRAAIASGGKTVAIMPGGLDRWYPSSHNNLAREILEHGGALISEYSVGRAVRKENFIARNRLVSGLCQAILITEASIKSGTLHTANFALEQGRDVLAVPGNITSETSVGTNTLIKTGATPITSTQDLLDYFGLSEQTRLVTGDTREEQVLLELLAGGLTESSVLLAASHLDPAIFNQTLTMLEITGRIKPCGAGQWSL